MSKKALTTRTLNPLPFDDLDPHRFEDLVRNLIYDFKSWKSIEALGRAGSDEGFDVRAWEATTDSSNQNEDDEYETETHPMEGNRWQLQCKREKQLGPGKMKEIISEGVDKKDPPYGYILAASTTFSKRSHDVFRDELRAKGVMEFYLWGKAELEDMLLLPKNDSILFAFFGISLITRKRSRASEIKFAINNKNKLLRIFNCENGQPQRELHEPILARDFKDKHYPYKSEYKDFDKLPRWKEYNAVGFHPLGLVVDVARRLAYLDRKTREWDFIDGVNLLHQQKREFEPEMPEPERKVRARSFWKHLRRANQATLIVTGLICFEDILIIDDKGDSEYPVPHIFVDFKLQSGPFRGCWRRLEVHNEQIEVDELKKISFFPKSFPTIERGRIFRDRSVRLNEGIIRSPNFLKCLFDVDGKYDFLNQRDVILVEGVEPMIQGGETFIQITNKYKIDPSDYLREGSSRSDRLQLERQIGRPLQDSDDFTVLEFETLPGWALRDEEPKF